MPPPPVTFPLVLLGMLGLGAAEGALPPEFPWALGVLPGWVRALGIVPLGLGAGLHAWAWRHLRCRNRSTGATAPPTGLEEGGPFARTRNPMYLGGLLMVVGWALALGGGLPWAGVPAYLVLVHPFILREESELEARFGPGYARYRSRVRRWF